MYLDEIEVYKVNQLSFVPGVESFGYLVICKQRGGNDKFFKWFNSVVVVDFVKTLQSAVVSEIRLSSGLESDSDDKNTAITFDGEHTQIMAYQDPEVLQLMEANKIYLCKLAASTTAVSQPLDAYKLFCACKSHLKGIGKEDLDVLDGLKCNVFNALSTHEDKYGSFRSGEKERISNCIVKCSLALRKSLNNSIIINSFNTVGLRNGKCDYSQVLRQYRFNLNKSELKDLENEIQLGTDYFMCNGTLTDVELDKIKSVANRKPDEADKKNRDERGVSQQRCAILNHHETLRRIHDSNSLKQQEIVRKQANKERLAENRRLRQLAKNNANNAVSASNVNINANGGSNNTTNILSSNVISNGDITSANSSSNSNINICDKPDVYCICKLDKNHPLNANNMVQCYNNEECVSNEWFHYACLKQDYDWIPPEKWICPCCTDARKDISKKRRRK